VEIDLLVRGICCLRPGLAGVSDRIRVTSIVDRFLEHSRVFAFGPPDSPDVYIASADWMPRNFLRRVELMFPVMAEAVRDRIRQEVLAPLALDNAQAYDMQTDGRYTQRAAPDGQPLRAAQSEVLDRAARGPLQVVVAPRH
jgi:polyphosphate kinase